MKPVYSICIPTFRRKEQVERLLGMFSGICGSDGLNEKIELCISDNSEDNGTESVVKRYLDKGFLRIRYHRWGKNVGYDRNAMKALSLATGEYLQLVSDEVSQDKEGLAGIIKALETKDKDGIYLNGKEKAFSGEPKLLFNRMLSASGIAQYFGTYMALLITRKSTYDRFLSEQPTERFCGKAFIHLPYFLYFLKNAGKLGFFPISMDSGRQSTIFPSFKSRLYINFYYALFKDCFESRILDEKEFARFRRNFLLVLPFLLLKVRIYLPPGLYGKEIDGVNKNIDATEKEYGGIQREVFSFWRVVLFNRIIPYHWIYGVWHWFKTSIRKDPATVDLFEEYERRKGEELKG